MNTIIAFALKHRVFMVMLFVMILSGGIIAFQQLNIEAYPDPTPPMVDIVTQSPGLSAEETDHVRDTIRLVRERGISVVVIDHNMRFISDLCDRVLVMAQGRELARGKPQEVLRNAVVIEAYLGKRYAQAGH